MAIRTAQGYVIQKLEVGEHIRKKRGNSVTLSGDDLQKLVDMMEEDSEAARNWLQSLAHLTDDLAQWGKG